MSLIELSAEFGIPLWQLIALLVWSLAWKGVSLWKSARNDSRVWFVVLLLVNTVGILEILYIFIFSKKGLIVEEVPSDEDDGVEILSNEQL